MTRRFKDSFAITLIIAAIAVVFYDLLTLDQAFLSGDHREQQYPWAFIFQEALRGGHLPWWTRAIHCGFPILAEGQIGAFYPVNILFYALLPIKWAYNYSILFHYVVGGLLFYAYLRRSGRSTEASFIAAVIFLFGSSQGGYFYYNYISQKVVIWLPLTLLLIDRLRERKQALDAFLLSLVFALQIFGGYLQVAIYSVLYSSIYFLFFWFRERSTKVVLLFTASGLLAIFFSLVQLLPTLELALLSSRAEAVKGIAYLGSATPMAWLTLFFPSWDSFLRSEFYVGILGLFFAIMSFSGERDTKRNFFVFGAALFFLLALGQYSPLYVGIVEMTGFNGFRTPIKFLFFVTFSMGVLAAYGWDSFFQETRRVGALKSYRFFVIVVGAMVLAPPVIEFVLTAFRETFLPVLKDYVTDHIFGRPGHHHSLEHYMSQAVSFYDSTIDMVTLKNKYTLSAWLSLVVGLVVALGMGRAGFKSVRGVQLLCTLLLFVDLFFYGFNSIKPNYMPFDSIGDKRGESAIVDEIKKDPGLFRISEVYGELWHNDVYPMVPSSNMLHGIDDVGAYSPLAMKDYGAFLKGWAYVNDSLSVNFVTADGVLANLERLSLLNVKYIQSTVPLEHEDLTLLMTDKDVLLYRNDAVRSRALFAPGMRGPSSLDQIMKARLIDIPIESYENQRVRIQFEAVTDGLFLLSDMAYPNWGVRVNGADSAVLKWAGLFRAVEVRRGVNDIVFEYTPRLYRSVGLAAAMTAILLSLFFLSRSVPAYTRRLTAEVKGRGAIG
ncbi:MAG: YfhO family protein [Candidatus Omnitrophota bacterium]|nr:YfhO family protein [Candidatus Omnitrophota bacterium]